ncbi:MAG: tRNA-dependent cyclodipeptide synthase [Prochloraceae cyanobacterium]|nr:tRNA-dependent cyclodipeptide synthase [Prochloraceae cyanobacterium]
MTIRSLASRTRDIENLQEWDLENELFSPYFIKINGERIVITLVLNTRTLCFNSAQKKFGTSEIVYATSEEVNNIFPGLEKVNPLDVNNSIDIFCAEELERYEWVSFYAGDSRYIIRMKYSDLKKIIQPQKQFLLTTTERYRMRVRYVAPENLRENLQNYPRCFLGVSLQTTNSSTAKIMSQVEWISRRFKHCAIFIADGIHRLTLQIKEKLSEERALNKALRLGRESIEYNSFLLDRYRKLCNFEFVLASEIQKSSNYAKYYQQLNNLYEKNDKFSYSVNCFARNFLCRGESIEDRERQDDCFSMSRQYLLEEMAIFTCLAEQNFPTFIYPGDLGIFKEIADGVHSDIPDALAKLNFISLKPILRK